MASELVEVRAASCDRLLQSPPPIVNPSRRKAPITVSFVAVSTFCSFATCETPMTLTAVNAATIAHARKVAPPRRSCMNPSETTETLSVDNAGEKYAR